MPDILIKCPLTGMALQTGLDTETVKFEDLPRLALPVKCGHCGDIHLWKPADAWVRYIPGQQRPRLGLKLPH
ncbi:MAG: hypothetical protein ACRC1G_16915 [Bradyrhizobium sp.]